MMMVCGEALLDVFAAGETRTGLTLDANVGGSPFNVAVGLARLGQPVGFFSAVSTGFAGERLMRALVAEGVDTQAIARLAAPTTLSLIGAGRARCALVRLLRRRLRRPPAAALPTWRVCRRA